MTANPKQVVFRVAAGSLRWFNHQTQWWSAPTGAWMDCSREWFDASVAEFGTEQVEKDLRAQGWAPSVWRTDEPDAHRVCLCVHSQGNGFFSLAIWSGHRWMYHDADNEGLVPDAWMPIPEGPGGAGHPRKSMILTVGPGVEVSDEELRAFIDSHWDSRPGGEPMSQLFSSKEAAFVALRPGVVDD